jgi:hypothetical protein
MLATLKTVKSWKRPFFQEYHLRRTTVTLYEAADEFIDKIRKLQKQDDDIQELVKKEDPHLSVQEDTILYDKKILVPEDDEIKLRILQPRHDHPTAVHPGITMTLQLDDATSIGKEYDHTSNRTSKGA